MSRNRSGYVVAGLAAGAAVLAALPAGASGGGSTPVARADAYRTGAGHPLTVDADRGVLANDRGGPLQLTATGAAAHGTVTLQPDGSFRYTPAAGFSGPDTFTYTVTNAVHLYTDHLPPLATVGGVAINAGAYGSAVTTVPGSRDEVYGLTDRGPNVTVPDGNAMEPIPSFDPAIGRFRLGPDGRAILERSIPLRDAHGKPYSGLVNTAAPTGEKIEDLNGVVRPADPDGYDSEGIVALRDGTFWVSDEYGPFLTHFDRNGRALGRLSPFDGTLPAELAGRVPNRGMEGLTVTPDGRTLVGIMQSALQQNDLNGKNAKNVVPVRIVTVDLRTHATHEYLYLLHAPKTSGTAVSEITALSATSFLVDERDGNYVGAGAFKQFWTIDLNGATDVGPAAHVTGAAYDPAHGGLLIGGTTIEQTVQGEDTTTAAATLAAAGITPVHATLALDLNALLLALDPQARFYSHDKVEGIVVRSDGTWVVSNDSDFGIDGVSNAAPPYQLHAKVSPTTGAQDNGEYLVIDPRRLPAATSTATVTVTVR